MFENLIVEQVTVPLESLDNVEWYHRNSESKRLYMGVIYTTSTLLQMGWSIEEIRRDTVAVVDKSLGCDPAYFRDAAEPQAPQNSVDFLKACIDVQAERGEQYDPNGTSERSFATVAEMFSTLRGVKLEGSDVCLILEFVKLARQYADPSRVHDDSLLDKVSYSSLWAEELIREHG